MSRIAVLLVGLLAVSSCQASRTADLSPSLPSVVGASSSSTQQMPPGSAATSTIGTPEPAATSTPAILPPATSIPARVLPADSPLTTCIDPAPPTPEPVDTAVAQDFVGGRIRVPLSLDDGTFRAVPAPPDAQPVVSAALALCNLLAGATANGSSFLEAANEHGMSFGLALVTVADSVLKPGPRNYLAGGRQQTASLLPYHARLAWIAVIKPDVLASCPSSVAPASTRSIAPAAVLPAYQILAIDADTGAAGIIYSAKTNALCGFPGYRGVVVGLAMEFVSVPWTLLSRGPGPKSAAISYQPRPCDKRDLGTFAGTDRPVVIADRTDPGLISVDLQRILLTTCGPAVPTPVLLRSSTLATDLPEHLTHAPVGAHDTLWADG